MKKSIIYLGIALVTFTNVALALDFQQSSNGESFKAAQTTLATENDEAGFSAVKVNRNKNGNPATINPETIEVPAYQKTMEEIIAENNQIIESTPEQNAEQTLSENTPLEIVIDLNPITTEMVMEERIQQDSQIIEGMALNAIQKEQK